MEFADIARFFAWVETAPPLALATLGTLLVGFALKRTARFPNDLIPVTLILVVCPALYIMGKYGMARFYTEAIVCGGLIWFFHGYLWKRFIAKRLPWKGSDGFDS